MKRRKVDPVKDGDKKSNDLLNKDIMVNAHIVHCNEMDFFLKKQRRILKKYYSPKIIKEMELVRIPELLIDRINLFDDNIVSYDFIIHPKINDYGSVYILYKDCEFHISCGFNIYSGKSFFEQLGETNKYHIYVEKYTNKQLPEAIAFLRDKIFYPERYFIEKYLKKTKLSTDILAYIKHLLIKNYFSKFPSRMGYRFVF
jgi:hypothetical protein